jgi:hypothetical protein
MLGSDNSVDPEDVRDELRTELVLLNGALKQLAPDLDFRMPQNWTFELFLFSCCYSSSAALELQHLKIENWNEFSPFLLSLGDIGERKINRPRRCEGRIEDQISPVEGSFEATRPRLGLSGCPPSITC